MYSNKKIEVQSEGFTLVEMLMSLTLSIMLLSCVFSLCVSLQKIYFKQVGLMQIQENIRVIAPMLTHELNHGCPGIVPKNKITYYHGHDLKRGSDGFSMCHEKVSYFIGRTQHKSQDGSVIYALYRKERGHAKTEIIENMNEMAVRYALLENGNMVERRAEQITDWSLVRALSIAYSLRLGETIKKGFIYAAI